MVTLHWSRGGLACISLGLLIVSGCSKPSETTPGNGSGKQTTTSETPATGGTEKTADSTGPAKTPELTPDEVPATSPSTNVSAKPSDVAAARERIDALGTRSECAPAEGDLLTEIVIQDGSKLTAEDFALFGKLTDLEELQILNCRTLNDEMAAKLSSLRRLTSLALTNTVINDATAEMIVKSFPNLTDLDLSSNTNLTNGVVKIISQLEKLERLVLIQNKVNDIGAQRLAGLKELQSLDLRGNMEAGDMALEVVANLPRLKVFKHRSTAVSDSGIEYLANNQSIESLLLQDFIISDRSGEFLAKLGNLSQLEIFRCQGFGSDGVAALKGMGLTRLTLRDLPNVDDRGMEVFDDLPKLRRLYLHELASVSDSGLQHLAGLTSLEQLDIWTVPQMTDATVDVIATLPKLKDLSIRVTDITDSSIDKLIAMPHLQSLTLKENGSVTAEGLKKLSTRKWAKLDIGPRN